MPNTVGRISGATFIGPGLGALPGLGCGKAVDVAVWKVTVPSTFFSTAFTQQRGVRLGSGFWRFEAHLMWFNFVTARLFHHLSIQPRLAATLFSSCSVANSPTRRVGLSPTLRPDSL